MNRVLSTARVQLAAWPSTLGLPWLILAISFSINLTIVGLLDAPPEDSNTTGGLAALYVFVFVAYVLTMTQYFPMLLGLSVTRRTFYLATGLMALAQALVYSTVILLFRFVEQSTGGWGISLSFFRLPFLQHDNVLLQLLGYAVPMLALAMLGIFCGVVFKRWGATGMVTLAVAALIVLGGLAVLATWLELWSAIGSWFAAQPTLSLLAGWPLLLALVLAAANFLVLRRATP